MRLDRLLRPQTIAVLGSGWALNVIEQCRKMGYAGKVWPVHPTRAEMGGLPTFKSLSDLPEPPDAAFVGVNRFATIEVVRELRQMGAGGAICFAAGWREAGEPELQQKLIEAAGDMPILGPNCYGMINYVDGALLWPDQHGGIRVENGVAIVSQSSNIVINMDMQRRALPIAYIACVGNAAVVGLAELTEAVLMSEHVTAVGLYIEGIDDAPAFAALAARAHALGKGMVAIKSGKTALSREAAASHTASLAGGGVVSSAFLRRLGIAEVNTPAELLETLKIMHTHGPAIGRRTCSFSCSGGEAGLVADNGIPLGIDFPPVREPTRQKLHDILGPIVAISNPLDYNTFIWGDLDKTTAVFSTLLADHDTGIFLIDPPRPDRCDPSSFQPAIDAIVAAQQATGKVALPISSLPENFGEERAAQLMKIGVSPLMGLETGLAAVRAAQTPAMADPDWRPLVALPAREVHLLAEDAAKALLLDAGIALPRAASAATLDELQKVARDLRPPLALKGLGFAHKTEAGAVRLGLTSLAGQAPMAGATGYLAEEMVQDVVAEILLGLRRDPVYGITLTLGFGGVEAELLADTVTLILPATRDDIMAALRRLRLWPLLDGYRGRPKGDVAALCAMAHRLALLMTDDAALEEIEINPILVQPAGAVAVDALIRRA